MKKINPNGSKTLYPSTTPRTAAAPLRAGVGGIYEVDKASGGSVTRTVTYYPVAGAMRINSTLYYVLKDHLGSASVVTDASRNILGEQRHYPFGETRLTTGTIYTDMLFTGQREMRRPDCPIGRVEGWHLLPGEFEKNIHISVCSLFSVAN